MEGIKKAIREALESADDEIKFLNNLRRFIYELSPIQHPVDCVQWVPIEQVRPNDYNPNTVAQVEMSLLHKSIQHDGYTQPVVVAYDPENDVYIIVDGFHRYYISKTQKDIQESTRGHLPVAIIDAPVNDRMASTIRHNRARGKHTIAGMSNLVFKMLENGWTDSEVCNELGMEPDEILRLKHLTGFSKLFEDVEYRKAWKSRRQVRLHKLSTENPDADYQELNRMMKDEGGEG